MRDRRSAIFNSILDTMENPEYKKLLEDMLETFPNYFWEVSASSTGKFHPEFSQGVMGLARHTCALVRILNYVLSIDCFKNLYSSEDRDCMRIAGVMHDSRKSGDDIDFAKSKYTRFDHPLLAANVVREFKGGTVPDDRIELIAKIIEAHSGQWNTNKYSDIVLPLPKDKYQKVLHLCDYLVSRKDVSLDFDKKEDTALPDVSEYKLTFGKHKGLTIPEIAESDPGYLEYLRYNVFSEPVKSLLQKYDETGSAEKELDTLYARLKEMHKMYFSDLSFGRFMSNFYDFVESQGASISVCTNSDLLSSLDDFAFAKHL